MDPQPSRPRRFLRRFVLVLVAIAATVTGCSALVIAGLGASICRPENAAVREAKEIEEAEYWLGMPLEVLDSLPAWRRDTTQLAPALRARGRVNTTGDRIAWIDVDTILGIALDSPGAGGASFRVATEEERAELRAKNFWTDKSVPFVRAEAADSVLRADPVGWPVEFTIRFHKIGPGVSGLARLPGAERVLLPAPPAETASQPAAAEPDRTRDWPGWKRAASSLLVVGCRVGGRLPERGR
jgi:hypothetical protein